MIEEQSAGAIIYFENPKENLFLLLNYPSGHWDFVKGKIEKGELNKDTVIRETQEETGIADLEFVEGFEEKIKYKFQFENQEIHKEVIFFLAKTRTKNVSISHEHLDFVWLNFDDAVKKTTFQNAKQLLFKVKNLLSKDL